MEWIARRQNPNDPDSWEWEVISPSGTGRSHYRIAGDMNKANAKLIALNPRMYQLLGQLADWDAGRFGKESNVKVIEISKSASALIAEAEEQ